MFDIWKISVMYCIEGVPFRSTQEFLRPADDIGWLGDWFIIDGTHQYRECR